MTTIILASALFLTACSNHNNNHKGTVVSKVEVQHNPAVIEPPISRTTNPSVVSTNTISVPQGVVIDIDLLERLRRGFQIADIDSKHTADTIKWSVGHASYLQDLLVRAEPFLYYIIEEIEKRELPMELALIPVIESAYKPDALSRSNASGLWQFIPSTGKGFGLRQDWWYDGRRDFIESTNAALDYLSQLNELFDGDWFLALAAYNAGQGTVQRAIRSNQREGKETHYQALSLREETRRYVPKLQAIKNIINNPAKYNVSLKSIKNDAYFEVVDLPGQLDLHEFSQLSGLDLDHIKHLNAGFLRWATSPDGPHRLLLPIASVPQARSALQKIAAEPSIQYHRHIIANGETLSTIGHRYGVTVTGLQNINKLSGTNIRAGKTLFIPLASKSTPAPTTGNSSSDLANTNTDKENKLIHRVVAGDTLWSISKRYKVALNQLLNWNQLASGHILQLNQSLLVFAN